MVEEVRAHMKEMLEVGAICPSQSPWFIAIMLVRKKDALLHRLLQVECKDQKDSYPLPHMQEAIESLMGAGYFSCLDLKAGFGRLPWTKHQSSILPSWWES